MTTPANRAPKVSLFGAPVVFEDDTGSWVPGYVAGHPSTGRILVRSYDGREDRVLLVSDDDVTWRRADGTIPFEPTTPADDPLGPALPGPAPVPAQKTLGQVCGDTYLGTSKPASEAWELAATAVIAAHEAGRGVAERVVRYALRGPDGKWWSHVKSEYVTDRTQRRLWEDRYEAEKWFEDGDTVVKVTITRRRRVVKS